MNILDAARDPAVFGPWFRDLSTWRAWFAFLGTLFGLPLDDDARAVFRAPPSRENRSLRRGWLLVGEVASRSSWP